MSNSKCVIIKRCASLPNNKAECNWSHSAAVRREGGERVSKPGRARSFQKAHGSLMPRQTCWWMFDSFWNSFHIWRSRMWSDIIWINSFFPFFLIWSHVHVMICATRKKKKKNWVTCTTQRKSSLSLVPRPVKNGETPSWLNICESVSGRRAFRLLCHTKSAWEVSLLWCQIENLELRFLHSASPCCAWVHRPCVYIHC